MNENLNLVEILKDCPKGIKLYSTIFGDVRLRNILYSAAYPIIVSCNDWNTEDFTADGKLRVEYDGECTLFPSKDQRDWSKFQPKKPKFDPKTLQPYDKVLVFNRVGFWCCDYFSHKIDEDYMEDCIAPYMCVGDEIERVIPYNDDTKHLVGTTEEAPEFYRYWED